MNLKPIPKCGMTVVTYDIHFTPATEKYVCCRFESADNKAVQTGAAVCDTLAEARSCVGPGMICFPRSPKDQATLVESWM